MSYLRPPSRSAARAFLAARASAGGAPVGGGGAVADRPGLGVPGYAHPLVAPVEWAELARPGVPLDWVAVHVAAGGAGARADPYCAAAIAALRGTVSKCSAGWTCAGEPGTSAKCCVRPTTSWSGTAWTASTSLGLRRAGTGSPVSSG